MSSLLPVSGTGTQVWLLKSVLLRDLEEEGREALSDVVAMEFPSLSRNAILSPTTRLALSSLHTHHVHLEYISSDQAMSRIQTLLLF